MATFIYLLAGGLWAIICFLEEARCPDPSKESATVVAEVFLNFIFWPISMGRSIYKKNKKIKRAVSR